MNQNTTCTYGEARDVAEILHTEDTLKIRQEGLDIGGIVNALNRIHCLEKSVEVLQERERQREAAKPKDERFQVAVMAAAEPEAGLPSLRTTVTFEDLGLGLETLNEDGREIIREGLIQLFNKLLDQKCGAIFSDECPECRRQMVRFVGTRGEGLKCPEQFCISNLE